jgi:hypothetical protein
MRVGSVSPMRKIVIPIALLLLLLVTRANSCEWAMGYFQQITALKGRVVGADIRGLPRWLRQSFPRKHAKLTLYEYQWPRIPTDLPLVKAVETDNDGRFDFGPVETGHYTLVVENDRFDVEVKDLPHFTESVTVDVSPFYPDCTGGHEFIVKTQ